jgi:hypothetical protein
LRSGMGSLLGAVNGRAALSRRDASPTAGLRRGRSGRHWGASGR